jgi:exonuclease SbcD
MIRALVLADTHLGFDLPERPRVRRRRRGHDFFANYERALTPALSGRVDFVIHGGDVLHRARVPTTLVYQAFEPLKRVADAGVPVFVVLGNHERSRLPHARFAAHPKIHLFDRPRSFTLEIRGVRLTLAGFPYEHRGIRQRFHAALSATGWNREPAEIRLLCAHQCVEGATVGPADYTFRDAPDVIRGRDIPAGFAAVLSGHIHRHQLLTADLRGRPLAAPVLYPGSIERTSIAEKDEPKGYVLLDLEPADPGGTGAGALEPGRGRVADWSFEALPARPMLVHEIGAEPEGLEATIRRLIDEAPSDAVLRIRVRGRVGPRAREILAAPKLRAMALPTMNIDAVFLDDTRWSRRGRASAPAQSQRDGGTSPRM